MSFEPDDEQGETQKKDIAEESLKYLKVIAYVLCEMQDLDLQQILIDTDK